VPGCIRSGYPTRDAKTGDADAGVHSSTNGGTSFGSTDLRPASMALARVREFHVDGDRLWAVTPRGVFMTQGWGWMWSEIDQGLNAWSVRAVGAASGLTLLSTSSGVLRSTNGGASWAVISDGFEPADHSTTRHLWLDPADANRVLVAGEGVFRSTSGGTSFSRIYAATATDSWSCTVVAQAGARIFGGSWTQLLVSLDDGGSWSPHLVDGSKRVIQDLLVDAAATALLVASDSGVYYSKDDGASFTSHYQGLGNLDVQVLAQAPGGGYLAGTLSGLYRSSGLAQPWTTAGLAGREVLDLLVSGNRLVAATDTEVFHSVDSGKSWKALPGLAGLWAMSPPAGGHRRPRPVPRGSSLSWSAHSFSAVSSASRRALT